MIKTPDISLSYVRAAMKARTGQYRHTVFALLLLFLAAVVFFAYFVPVLDFGRPFGTDEYTHLFHTGEMAETTSLYAFYNDVGKKVASPESPDNPFNYPFGLWLYGSVLSKVTGLSPYMTVYLFGSIFLVIILLIYSFYANLFLEKREQVLVALLFLVSMPNVALIMQSYRPSVFVIPFLLLVMYIALLDRPSWRDYLLMLVAVFFIALSHTGTYIFLITFSMVFLLMYCLIWGKFAKPVFVLSAATFFIYVFAMDTFPHIYPQYAAKSTMFLQPGKFFAEYLYLDIAEELTQILYTNLFIQRELVYALIWAAFIFAFGMLLLSVHRRAARIVGKFGFDRAFAILPIQNISHSALASPLWIGPVQVLLSLAGWFRLDGKGKCLLVSAAVISLFPSVLQASEGIEVATGVLREISFLVVIIPIASTLGLWYVLGRLDRSTSAGRFAAVGLLVVVFTSAIVIPVVGNGYYNPQITGEDYVVSGMQWLSGTGSPDEKVVGYGYRTVPVFTGKEDGTYGLRSGTETRTFLKTLRRIHFEQSEKAVQDLYSFFGAKYLMTSDKLVANLAANLKPEESVLSIDENGALDKIYASNDFGIYGSLAITAQNTSALFATEQISAETFGSTTIIEAATYKVFLDETSPTIRYIGTSKENYLGGGVVYELLRISGLSGDQSFVQYLLSEMVFDREIQDNRIIYSKVLTNENGKNNLATLQVIYTFYADAFRREYVLSNDWLDPGEGTSITAYLSTNYFIPYDSLVLKDGYKRFDKTIYPSEDSITLNNLYDTVFVNDGKNGIYLRYAPTAPRPSYLSYKGSTIYNATSTISVGQIETVKPGASVHVTQYIAIGDEASAEESIEGRMSIELLPYPDGIIPMVLVGTLTSQSDDPDAKRFYDLNRVKNLYFTEAADTSILNVREVIREGVDIIGLKNMRSGTGLGYASYAEQDDAIRELVRTARLQDISLEGFMPQALIYNPDTIRVLDERNIGYMLAIPVRPPFKELNEEGLRHPQIARYQGASTDLVLLPVSYPMSMSLGYSADEEEAFTSWRDVIDAAAEHDDLALFAMRSTDMGSLYYANRFMDLVDYANLRGLTFTSPEIIADHFRLLQQVTWSSFRDLDSAQVVLHNGNKVAVDGVTLKVTMPRLAEGSYRVTNGAIVRTRQLFDQEVLYITTGLGPGADLVVTVEPDVARKQFTVVLPGEPIEGEVVFSVLDENGAPLQGAVIYVNSLPYKTGEDGSATISMVRGVYRVKVEKAGYVKAEYDIEVLSRIHLITRFFGL